MSLKEKMDEYKNKKEAKDFFNSHNNQVLDTKDYPKIILSGMFVTIVIAIIQTLITTYSGIDFSFFYIINGIVVAETICRISDIRSKQMGIIAAIITFLGIVVTRVMVICYMQSALGLGFQLNLSVVLMAITSLFTSLYSFVFFVIGIVMSFNQAND